MGSKYNYNKKDNKSFVQSKDNTDDTCEDLNCNKNSYSYKDASNKKNNSSNSYGQSSNINDCGCEEGIIGGGFHTECRFTNCILCPGVYSDGHFKIVCECDCHKIEKHF